MNSKYEIFNKYVSALSSLDQYDHQDVKDIKGTPSVSSINYLFNSAFNCAVRAGTILFKSPTIP